MHLAHYGVERRRHRRLPAGKDLHDGLVVAQRTGLITLESIEYSLPGVGVTQVLHDHARAVQLVRFGSEADKAFFRITLQNLANLRGTIVTFPHLRSSGGSIR